MRDLRALSGLFAVAALFTVTMAALTVLVSSGHAGFLVPTPESTAEEFLGALKAHRFAAARDQLSEGLRGRVTTEQLRALALSLEGSRGGIAEVRGVAGREQGDVAEVTVRVEMGDGTEEEVSFPLVKEQEVWKIGSIEPLERPAYSFLTTS